MNPLWAIAGIQALGSLGGFMGDKGKMTPNQLRMLEYQTDITKLMRDTMAQRFAQEQQFMPYLLSSVFQLGAQKMLPRRTSITGKGVYEPKRGTPEGLVSDLSFMQDPLKVDYTFGRTSQEDEIKAAEEATGENVAGPVISNEKDSSDTKKYNVLGQVIYDPDDPKKSGKPVAGVGGEEEEIIQPPSNIPSGEKDMVKRLWYIPNTSSQG